MRYRNVTRLLVKASTIAGAAGLLAALPATDATAAPKGEGSAYGLSVTGPVGVPPVPAVSSRSAEVRKSLLREDSTKLVKASALDVKATSARAGSTVAHLAVPMAKLGASAVAVKCDGGRGSTRLAHALLAGKGLNVAPPPNTTVPVRVNGVGKASLVLNKQRRTADGRLAVTGMVLNLPVGKGASVQVAHATCGKHGTHQGGVVQSTHSGHNQQSSHGHHAHHGKSGNHGNAGGHGKPGEAPAPSPVRNDLPVTG